MKSFPMSTKDDMVNQVISTRKKFPTYKAYGMATIDDLWTMKDREGAIIMQATDMASSYIQNEGDGHFIIKPLPLEAQTAPVYGMMSEDVDDDGNADLLMAGNDYGMEPYSGRHDAFIGLCLKGDGKGNFQAMPVTQTGFYVKGDAKGMAKIHTAKGEDLFVITQNQDSIVVFDKTNHNIADSNKWINLKPEDFSAEIEYNNHKKRYVEFYYGSTYLSQSSRKFLMNKNIVRMTVTDFKGLKRELIQ